MKKTDMLRNIWTLYETEEGSNKEKYQKRAAIHLKQKDDKCFQYVVTIALNYGDIEHIKEKFQILNRL